MVGVLSPGSLDPPVRRAIEALKDYSDTSFSPSAGFRNKVINGDFRVWQRGGGAFTGNGDRTADMWSQAIDAVGTTMSTTLQLFTAGDITKLTPVPTDEPIAFMRCVVVGAANVNNYSHPFTRVEGVRSLSGQTVTLSFWAKADAVKPVAIEFQQQFGTGGSPSSTVFVYAGQVTLSTSWQRYSVTATLPSLAGKTLGTSGDNLTIAFWTSAGSAFVSRVPNMVVQSGTFDFWGVQLEQGSVATVFEHRPHQVEMALCQRYFRRTAVAAYGEMAIYGYNVAGTALGQGVTFPVPMRAVPTVTAGGTFLYSNVTGGVNVIADTQGYFKYVVSTASAHTFCLSNNSGYVDFAADL